MNSPTYQVPAVNRRSTAVTASTGQSASDSAAVDSELEAARAALVNAITERAVAAADGAELNQLAEAYTSIVTADHIVSMDA